jgi:hypothetical protein
VPIKTPSVVAAKVCEPLRLQTPGPLQLQPSAAVHSVLSGLCVNVTAHRWGLAPGLGQGLALRVGSLAGASSARASDRGSE